MLKPTIHSPNVLDGPSHGHGGALVFYLLHFIAFYFTQLIAALIVYQSVDQSIVVLIDMLASVSRAARRAYPEVQACFRTVSSTQTAMNTSLRPDVCIIMVICVFSMRAYLESVLTVDITRAGGDALH